MDFDQYDPTSPIDFHGMINTLTAVLLQFKLDRLETILPELLAARFPEISHLMDWDYIDRFACSAYGVAIGMPMPILMMLGGPIALARVLMTEPSEKFTPAVMTEKLQTGFSQHSPTMGKVLTQDMLVKVVRLILLDWLENGTDDPKQMQQDTHFYMHGILAMDGDYDAEAVRREAFANMTAEDFARMPPEVRKAIEAWKKSAGID